MKTEVIIANEDLLIHEIPMSIKGKLQGRGSQVAVSPYKADRTMGFNRYNLIEKGYQEPEYNLYDISTAEDVEGIISRSIKKKSSLMAKAGWTITGKNNEIVDYINLRFLQIELCQGKTMNMLFKELASDIVTFHNAYLIKYRKEELSGGETRTVRSYSGEKKLKPIAAYFRAAPETMRVKTDDYGNPIKYMQIMPDSRTIEYSADDVIHFYFHKRAGMSMACPGYAPAIDDIRALRRTEDQVEILIDQYLFPFFTITIGTDESPMVTYSDGSTEVDKWKKAISAMPTSGGLTLSNRHKLDIHSAKNVLPVNDYLDHFKRRAYASSGVSNLDMGEGDGMNRSTADNASAILIEDAKDYQFELGEQINFQIINELLLEKYSYNVLLPEHRAYFSWGEIDTESMMKLENHNAMMYQMGQITHDEMRLRNNMKLLDSEEEKAGLFLYENQKQVIDWQTESAIEVAKHSATISQPKNGQSNKAVNSVQNKNQPANQHGTKIGPESKKSSLEPSLSISINSQLKKYVKNDKDYAKNLIINWLFSFDNFSKKGQFCTETFKIVDKLVDNANRSMQNGFDQTVQDVLIKNISTYLKQAMEEYEL